MRSIRPGDQSAVGLKQACGFARHDLEEGRKHISLDTLGGACGSCTRAVPCSSSPIQAREP